MREELCTNECIGSLGWLPARCEGFSVLGVVEHRKRISGIIT
jgi:hypothetical protein